MVIRMEIIVYDIQEKFLPYVKKHPKLLEQLPELSMEQQVKIIQMMDEEEVKERAVHYFNNDAIYIKDHVLHYENTLRGITYKMKIETHQITVFGQDNPFLPFLKRIFRRFFAYPLQGSNETR